MNVIFKVYSQKYTRKSKLDDLMSIDIDIDIDKLTGQILTGSVISNNGILSTLHWGDSVKSKKNS